MRPIKIIKRLAIAALLFAPPLFAPPLFAAAPLELCDGGAYYPRGTCPPVLSNPMSGANKTSTETDFSITLSGLGPRLSCTLYACAFPTGTDKTFDEIVDDSSCTTQKSKASITADGTYTFQTSSADKIDGLSASTSYEIGAAADCDSRPNNDVETSNPFSTLAGGGSGGTDLTGTGFFAYGESGVSGTDCDDSWTGGLAEANGGPDDGPWCSLANLSTLSAGDDIYLRRGGTWQEAVDIDWGGTSGDRIIFACYYLDSANSDQPTSCHAGNDIIAVGDADMPKIYGTFESSCRTDGSCDIQNASAIPTSIFQGLVRVTSDYVTIRNIWVTDSAGEGIDGDGDFGGADGTLTSTHIEDSLVEHTAFAGMQLDDDVINAEVRGNTFRYMTWCEKGEQDGNPFNGGNALATCNSGGQPGCVAITRTNSSYSLIENNLIHSGRCEGIATSRASNVWIRNNRVGNVGIAIYGSHSSQNIVEGNIAWGNPDNGNQFVGTTQEGALGFGLESNGVGTEWAGGDENIVRNNMVAGGDHCLYLNNLAQASVDAGLLQGFYAYGNTCVGQSSSSVFLNRGSGGIGELHIIGNIVYSPNASTASGCRLDQAPDEISHNNWPSNPSDSDCDGTGDIYTDPGLPLSIAAYEGADYTTGLDYDDFKLPAGSSDAKDASTLPTLPAWATSVLQDSGWDNVTSEGGGISSCDGTLNETLTDDADCVNRDASPHMGAQETTL